MKKVRFINATAIVLLACFSFNSCDSFLDVAQPTSKIPVDVVFKDDATATSALTGIYIDLYLGSGFASGSLQSVTMLGGLSADELVNAKNDPDYLEFQRNAILPAELVLESFWGSMYQIIYECNSLIEGVEASRTITEAKKKQLRGEALFIRAFTYFYLVNFFGDVPLATTTDYKTNSVLTRSPVSDVYDQIKRDLSECEDLLPKDYPGTDRTHPNQSAATALLARVYLYTGDWSRAEDKATRTITNSIYTMPSDVNSVFLTTSKEAIWQLRPVDGVGYTNEAYWFNSTSGSINDVLREEVIDSFEPTDKRKTNWISGMTAGDSTIYIPFKYKESRNTSLPDEYSVVLRLAELYLIRAEARLQLDKIPFAIADVDVIRKRAGLPLIADTDPSIGKDDLMLAIEQERKIELLTEWGHRWLDLKRWNKAATELTPLKPGFSEDDQLYPVPSNELIKNQNLHPQNPGY